MSLSDTYIKVLKSYEENPKVQILRKIRGEKALKMIGLLMNAPSEWLAGWTDSEKKAARGFLYVRRLRTNVKYGIKVISKRGGEDSVLGHEVSERQGVEFHKVFI